MIKIKTTISFKFIIILIVFCFGLLTFRVNAQLNESDTMRVQIRVGINGIRQTGNVDLGIVRSRLDFVGRLSESFVFKSQNNSLYQEFSGWKADNDVNSRNYLYFKPQSKIYPFAMAYMQSNFRLKIKFRNFAGAGATWQIIRNEHQVLKFSGSLVHEKTDYSVENFNEAYYSASTKIRIWRPTVYLAGMSKISDSKIKLHYYAYWQPGLAEVPNQRIQAEAGLDFQLIKGLNLTAQMLYYYEQVVPVNVKQNDILYTFGASYQFKK